MRYVDYFNKIFKVNASLQDIIANLYNLEQILSNLTTDTSLIILQEDGKFGYVVEQRDSIEPDNYCHWIGPVAYNRIDALLSLLMSYSFIDELFYSVRDIFKTTEKVVNDNKREEIEQQLEDLFNEKKQQETKTN